MKFLIFACIIAVSLAAPVAKPDDDDDNMAVESRRVVTSFVRPSVVDTQIFSETPIFQQNAIAYSVPVSINQGPQVYTRAVPYSVGASEVYKAKKIDNDDDDDDDDSKSVKSANFASAPERVSIAAAPAITAYSAGQAVATPAITSYKYQQAIASPSAASYSVSNTVGPIEVLQPVNVPTQYAVTVAQPVKVKSSVTPFVNVDLHTVQTENIVTPIEYTANRRVATAPAAGIVANVVPTAVTYEATAPAAFAVQNVATRGVATGGASTFGVLTQDVAPYGVASQGVVTGGQAVGYAATPVAQNVIYRSSPTFVQGTDVPSVSFTGQNFNQGQVQFVAVGETSANTVPQVTLYSGGSQGVVQRVISGTPNSVFGGGSQVYFDASVN